MAAKSTAPQALRVRVLWGDAPISDVVLSPPRSYSVGEGGDFLLPEEALGRPRLEVVRVVGGRTFVAVTPGFDGCHMDPDDPSRAWVELGQEQQIARVVGGFTLQVTAEEPVRSPVRRYFVHTRGLRYFFGALFGSGAVLGGLAFFSPPMGLTDESTMSPDQLLLIQQYLQARAERESEREPKPAADAREGGTGTRAKGLEGSMGNSRFAIRGATASEPHVARAAALREAQEFGMVGLLNTSAGGAPSDPHGAPAGRPNGNGAPNLDGTSNSGEEYTDFGINAPVDTSKDHLATFAVDVDTGAYTIAKRTLLEGQLPPPSAVRVEEFVNAFDYGYAGPEQDAGNAAFRVHLAAAPSPFERGHHVLRVGIQGRRVPKAARSAVHLVYLVDTSGSMQSRDKLALAQDGLRLLTKQLRAGDTVALCTYAGEVREVLPPTPAQDTTRILAAIDQLSAGGSTAMASGIDLAYTLAERTLRPGEQSRVIVLSDGDANVGPRSADEILKLIARQRRRGVTLSTVGFGRGNYKDSTMEALADAGDGNYSYIGGMSDARRVFVENVEGMLNVIARDVKIQVDFDPAVVAQYRLIGYENRDVADGDFENDQVDGGEVGSGHAVTALFDVVLRQRNASPLTVRLRHKPAEGNAPAIESAVAMSPLDIAPRMADTDASFRLAVSVAELAESLRGSPYALGVDLRSVERQIRSVSDDRPEREELADMTKRAADLRNAS